MILYYILYPFIKLNAWVKKMEAENKRMEEEIARKMTELAMLRLENRLREQELNRKGR